MTDKFFSAGKIFQYYLPVTLGLFMLITIERTVETDGGFDRLYGLPLPYISSAFAWSFHYHVYILPMVLNLLFYFGITVLIFAGLSKLGLKLKLHWALIILSTLVILFFAFSVLIFASDSNYYLIDSIEYKTTGRRLIFISP